MKCPNCGRDSEGDRCPYCGHSARSGGGNRVAAVLIAVLLVAPAALVGACSAFAVLPANRDREGYWQIAGLIGLVALAVFLGGLALVVRLWRRP